MIVYLGREWSGVKTKELARQLQRDPSVISRLYDQYRAKRDLKIEARLLRVFQK
jgi:ribosome-binding protein aMBF1 (putative translation factor)